MPNSPYVGVSGVVSKKQVEDILMITEGALPGDYKLMIGALVTATTLDGGLLKERRFRYAPVKKLKDIFLDHPLFFNLIHYHSSGDRRGKLAEDIDRLVETAGPNLHGIQFNHFEPPYYLIDKIRDTHPNLRLVLQLGSRVLDRHQNLGALVKYVDQYDVDYILLDASGGNAQLFKLGESLCTLDAIQASFTNLKLGIAGGLTGGTVGRLTGLLQKFPDLSFDAEGGLMVNDVLDFDAVRLYLVWAKELLHNTLGISSR